MTEMSVDPLKEPLEATVAPVQVDPFSDAQTQNHIIFWSLCQKKIIALQYIISLKERRDEVRKIGPSCAIQFHGSNTDFF